MTDLRSACIEAMADAWARLEEGEDYEMSGVAWANLRAVAAVQLDALLGVLEEHADEWAFSADLLDEIPWPPRGMTLEQAEKMHDTKPLWLLAVLREDT